MREWRVYKLMDPRDGRTFYVGVSVDVGKRLADHERNRSSSAYGRLRAIARANMKVIVEIDSVHGSKAAALKRERELIGTVRGTRNKARPGRRALWAGIDMRDFGV